MRNSQNKCNFCVLHKMGNLCINFNFSYSWTPDQSQTIDYSSDNNHVITVEEDTKKVPKNIQHLYT